MGNSVVDISGKAMSKFREIREIMQQPSMKVKLLSFVDEAVKCKQKIGFENENLKALRTNAQDELGIKPAVFNAYVSMVHSNDYVQRKGKLEELVDMVDFAMEEAHIPLNAE